jgi:hypothetical protein
LLNFALGEPGAGSALVGTMGKVIASITTSVDA